MTDEFENFRVLLAVIIELPKFIDKSNPSQSRSHSKLDLTRNLKKEVISALNRLCNTGQVGFSFGPFAQELIRYTIEE